MKESLPGLHGNERKQNGLRNAAADKQPGKVVQHLGRFKIRQNLHPACQAVRTDNPAYFKELHGGIIR